MRASLLAILMAFLAISCRSPKIVVERIETAADTIVNTRYERIQTIDTIYVALPSQSAERTSADSVSHLETDYAESLARINADGTLYHDLRTKQTPIAAYVPRETERRDSIVYVSNIAYVETPVMVEKELTWWQKAQLRGFRILILIVIVFVVLKFGPKIIRQYLHL